MLLLDILQSPWFLFLKGYDLLFGERQHEMEVALEPSRLHGGLPSLDKCDRLSLLSMSTRKSLVKLHEVTSWEYGTTCGFILTNV